MIEKGKDDKEEDVDYISEDEIQFKVILTEINIERKRFLLLNRKTKHI
jgi:hypothetical protein